MTTTNESQIFQFNRTRDATVLTAEHDGFVASVWLVRPGSPGALPTYAWAVMGVPADGKDRPPCVGCGYGEGASVSAAEAMLVICQMTGAEFTSFEVVD